MGCSPWGLKSRTRPGNGAPPPPRAAALGVPNVAREALETVHTLPRTQAPAWRGGEVERGL